MESNSFSGKGAERFPSFFVERDWCSGNFNDSLLKGA